MKKLSILKIELLDLYGKKIKLFDPIIKANDQDALVDISGISPGIYFVILKTKGFSRVKKITLQ